MTVLSGIEPSNTADKNDTFTHLWMDKVMSAGKHTWIQVRTFVAGQYKDIRQRRKAAPAKMTEEGLRRLVAKESKCNCDNRRCLTCEAIFNDINRFDF